MKKTMILMGVLFALSTVLFAIAVKGDDRPKPAYASDRIKIKLSAEGLNRTSLPSGFLSESSHFGLAELDRLIDLSGATKIIRAHRQLRDRAWEERSGFDRWLVIKLDGRMDVRSALTLFKEHPLVEEAIPEYIAYATAVPNDTYYANNWGHNNTAQLPFYTGGSHSGAGVGTVGFDSDAQLAWDETQGYGSASIVIAIIDSGVDTTHPDLRLVTGYDYGDNDADPMDNSADPGHGTSCSGIAAARANNSLGVTGSGGGCSVMPLKVADSAGDMYFTAIENAISHAADNGVDVISMSLGAEGGMGEGDSPSTDTILYYAYNAGVVIFAATANANTSAIAYPSNHTAVISVGAASPTGQRKSTTSSDGETWWGSNYGVNTQNDKEAVDIMGPTILPATDLVGTVGYSTTNYYLWFNGTSCATPYVAGVAALVLSKTPTLTPAQVREALVTSATDMTVDGGAGWDRYTGYGLVNAFGALNEPPEVTWDQPSISQSLNEEGSDEQNLIIGNTGEMVLNYTISKPVTSTTYLDQGFATTSIPTGWTQEYVSGTVAWVFATGGYNTTNPATAYEGSYNARLYYANSSTPYTTKLVSTPIDLSGTTTASLTFWHTQAYWAGDQDQLKVYYKTSSGGSWTQLAHYTNSITTWTQETIALPNLSATYYLAFEGITDYGYGVCLDKIVVSKTEYTAPWLTINGGNTYSGSVNPPSKDQDVIVIGFDATGLPAGTYNSTLLLTTNSPSNPSVNIPVSMDVEEPLPVTLSSFTAIINSGNQVRLDWITQSESGALGYYLHRCETEDLASALQVSELIHATNTSQMQQYSFTDTETTDATTYYYWLQSLDMDGMTQYHGPVTIATSNLNTGTPVIPLVTQLHPAYPNPFNPTTTLAYTLAQPGLAQLDIYNQRGQLVRSFQREHTLSGHFALDFDGKDSSGSFLASGIYFYRLTVGGFIQQMKMVLSK